MKTQDPPTKKNKQTKRKISKFLLIVPTFLRVFWFLIVLHITFREGSSQMLLDKGKHVHRMQQL